VSVVEWATLESQRLLAGSGDRWLHVQGVVQRAREVAAILPDGEPQVLLAAAWLHDIGYSPQLHRAGAHQLDGARYLRAAAQERLACLVAHHSEARFELAVRGMASELATFEREESAVSDALTYCDLLTSPTGEPMSLQERVAEVEARYGEGRVVQALRRARPALEAAIGRVTERLALYAGAI
jgi:hypothetical protein